MKFTSPWNLLFLSFLIPVILMYILKQKFEEKEISSIYLWDRVLKDIEVNTPWQRLKKNILLILQILAVVFLVFALTNPYVFMKGKGGENLVVVLDNSGSMNAKYKDTTRFNAAKNMVREAVRSAAPGGRITLISCSKHPRVEISTGDKNEVLSRLNDIKATNYSGSIKETVSLIKALSKQYKGTRAQIYTDEGFDLEGVNGEINVLPMDGDNVSLDYIAHSIKDEYYRVMVRATNRGNNDLKREISLFSQGKLIDLKEVDIKKGETITVYFDKVPLSSDYVYAEITQGDSLNEDNIIYDVIRQSEKKRVLLLTDKNIFLEKALNSFEGLELFKTNDMNSTQDKYDLYIFDGSIPEKMPSSGSIMIVNPPDGNEIVKTSGEVKGGISSIQRGVLTKYMDDSYFTISKVKNIETPYWADIAIKAGDKGAVLYGEVKGRKICLINFDLHDSDFVLTPEFPIFINNAMRYLVDMGFEGSSVYKSGDNIEINPIPDAKSAYIKSPSGNKNKLSIKYPVQPFTDTNELGIYTFVQNLGNKETNNIIAVNFPTGSESGIISNANLTKNLVQNNIIQSYGKSIQVILLILLLSLLAVEWVVYTRGY